MAATFSTTAAAQRCAVVAEIVVACRRIALAYVLRGIAGARCESKRRAVDRRHVVRSREPRAPDPTPRGLPVVGITLGSLQRAESLAVREQYRAHVFEPVREFAVLVPAGPGFALEPGRCRPRQRLRRRRWRRCRQELGEQRGCVPHPALEVDVAPPYLRVPRSV